MTNQPAVLTTSVPDLSLCLHRLHGKRVQAEPVRVSHEGLTLGAESAFLAPNLSPHSTQRHGVALRHGFVRPCEGGWLLEPATTDLVLTLNGHKIPWGHGTLLHPGDTIELGFAAVRVEGIAGEGVEAAPFLPPETPDEPLPAVPAPDVPLAVTQTTGLPSLPEAEPPAAHPSPAEHEPPSPAEELCALLAEDARNSTGSDSMHYAAHSTGADSLESLLYGAEPAISTNAAAPLSAPLPDKNRPARRLRPHCPPSHRRKIGNSPPAADDPLAALAAESARVLASGGRFFPVENAFSRPPAGQNAPDPLVNLAAGASLEEILEGPITIDHVLDKLQRERNKKADAQAAHPLDALIGPQASAPLDPLDALQSLDGQDRQPDPLLLLAGMTSPVVREPELPPVLHKEHRSTGIDTPYQPAEPQADPESALCRNERKR